MTWEEQRKAHLLKLSRLERAAEMAREIEMDMEGLKKLCKTIPGVDWKKTHYYLMGEKSWPAIFRKIDPTNISAGLAMLRTIRSLGSDLRKGIIYPSIKIPSIPGKQKEFTINETANYAGVSRRQVDYDKEVGKLPIEKRGRLIIILRKNLIKYVNEKRKNRR